MTNLLKHLNNVTLFFKPDAQLIEMTNDVFVVGYNGKACDALINIYKKMRAAEDDKGSFDPQTITGRQHLLNHNKQARDAYCGSLDEFIDSCTEDMIQDSPAPKKITGIISRCNYKDTNGERYLTQNFIKIQPTDDTPDKIISLDTISHYQIEAQP